MEIEDSLQVGVGSKRGCQMEMLPVVSELGDLSRTAGLKDDMSATRVVHLLGR